MAAYVFHDRRGSNERSTGTKAIVAHVTPFELPFPVDALRGNRSREDTPSVATSASFSRHRGFPEAHARVLASYHNVKPTFSLELISHSGAHKEIATSAVPVCSTRSYSGIS
jgi:hypothetical protein